MLISQSPKLAGRIHDKIEEAKAGMTPGGVKV
jgi:hypothetical protein